MERSTRTTGTRRSESSRWRLEPGGACGDDRLMARILVVEDSPSMRSFVRASLETSERLSEVTVEEAGSGFDALRMLPRGQYDLVITDINMPDINGLELMRFLASSDQHRSTPVLVISTQAAERDRERGLALGARGYLVKPFTADQLCDTVARVLGTVGGTA